MEIRRIEVKLVNQHWLGIQVATRWWIAQTTCFQSNIITPTTEVTWYRLAPHTQIVDQIVDQGIVCRKIVKRDFSLTLLRRQIRKYGWMFVDPFSLKPSGGWSDAEIIMPIKGGNHGRS